MQQLRQPSAEQARAPEQASTTTSSGPQPSNAAVQERQQGGPIERWLVAQIQKNLSADKVDEAALDAIRSGGDSLKSFLMSHADPSQAAQLEALTGEAINQIVAKGGNAFKGSNISEAVSEWLAEHPFTTGAIGIAGAAGYILSDQDLSFGTGIDIGSKGRFSIDGDFGSTMKPGLDGIRAGYAHTDGPDRFALEGGSRFDRDEWDANASWRRQLGEGTSLTVDGKHKDVAGDTQSSVGVTYDSPSFDAWARAGHDSSTDLSSFNAGFGTDRPGTNFSGSIDASSDGAWGAKLDARYRSKDSDLEWFAGVGAGKDAQGRTDMSARAGLSLRF